MSFSVKSLLGVLIIILFFNGSALAVEREILSVQKLKEPRREKTIDFKSAVSKRNLLNLERKFSFSLPYLSKESIAPTIIKILAIRVQFKKEIPDDPATTGIGWFDLRSYEQFYLEEEHIIDPAPHNRQYFETHIQALGNYWNIVSQGKIQFEIDVYPKGDTAYTLPYTMSHYGSIDSTPNPQFYPVEQLDSLFKHSFKLADTSSLDEIDFASYDSYFLFHAGSDQQHDLGEIGIDPTPSDLFTGFIMLGEPVVVKDAQIWEGLILPETASQDNRITALNSLIAHEFGHQLGLVDLYNTRNFFTQVGDFALMDNFAQNVGVELDSCFTLVTGVLPVYPCGWSKAFLGFVEPVEINNQQNISLLASELLEEDAIQLIKVPISSEEYFLIENRQIDLDGVPIPYLQADSITGVVLGLVEFGTDSEREYDYLMPGSGILIYRIDEGVAYLDVDSDGVPNFWDNKLQWDKDRKFITLMEADGIIDFGGNYYTGFGSQEDMYYQGNQSEFTSYTYPSTRTRTGAFTHIRITDIGESGLEMSLNVKLDWHQSGWPQKIVPHFNVQSLTFADVENDGSIEIFGAVDRFVYAWRSNGESLIPNPNYAFDIELNGDTTFYPLAFFDILDTTLVGTPTLGDVDGDDTLEIVSATVDGKVYCWEPIDLNDDSLADIKAGFPVDLVDSISMVPVVSDFDTQNPGLEIYIGTGGGELFSGEGRLFLISGEGNIIDSINFGERVVGLATTDSAEINFLVTENDQTGHIWKHNWRTDSRISIEISSSLNSSPAVCDLNRDDLLDVIVVGGNGKVHAWDKELLSLPGFPVDIGDSVKSEPALGDIDGDGYLEIVIASNNKIFAYNYNGTIADNFQIIVDRVNPVGCIKSSPVLVDVDDDWVPEVVIGTGEGRLYAFKSDGNKIRGFPLSCAGAISSSAVIKDLDGDSESELVVPCDDGFVYAWKLPWRHDHYSNHWPMQGHDPSHTNYFPIDDLPDLPKFAFLPEKKVYSYPNPAKEKAIIRYFLGEDAEVNIKIYDLAGDLVEELDHAGVGGENNEKEWDCSKAASGVYLCRVEAKSSSQEEVVFCKIAVVK